jgi:hypothetical protein
MISLIIAGGVYAAATAQPTQWPDIDNHTLKGEAIPASQVVTRTRWGTPMLPDGKGGYSLIAPINQDFILESLIIPPWNLPSSVTTQDVIYRPLPPDGGAIVTEAPAPAPMPIAPVAPAPGMNSIAPVEPTLPAPDAAPVVEPSAAPAAQ